MQLFEPQICGSFSAYLKFCSEVFRIVSPGDQTALPQLLLIFVTGSDVSVEVKR